MVLVLAVLVQASECPRNHHMGGERGGTTVNIEFGIILRMQQNSAGCAYSKKEQLRRLLSPKILSDSPLEKGTAQTTFEPQNLVRQSLYCS
jgi:hypothetical protein